MKEPRLSFESSMTDEEADAAQNSGLKLKPSRTRLVKKDVQQNFEQRVRNTSKRLEGNLKSAYELGVEFNNLLDDMRLAENIGPYERSFEKELLRKLINYGIAVNNDEQETEGMGSISLITLVMKHMFKMRDRMNKMSYDNHKLERRILHLEKSILSSQPKAADESK